MHHALNDENISDLGEPDVANRVIKNVQWILLLFKVKELYIKTILNWWLYIYIFHAPVQK